MSGLRLQEMVRLLMLIPFGLVFGIGILFILSAIRWARQRAEARLNHVNDIHFSSDFFASTHFRDAISEQPCRWLAIKGNSPAAVRDALHLTAPTPCSWEKGLMEARERKLFITPPISGWILVFGSSLPDPTDDVDKCFRFLMELSRQLGHVQFFSANRVLSHHAWALIEQNRVFRAYAWGGNTLWNQGQMTAAEKELKLKCFDYADGKPNFDQKDFVGRNTERVSQLAARWSIDPSSIDGRRFKSSYGIAGELSRF